MKIYKPIGSKERFFEMVQKINKINLNENFEQNFDSHNVVNFSFEELKNGRLSIDHSNTQTNDNETFIELVCTDKARNNITFTFKLVSSEGDQEGIHNIDNISLIGFTFDDIKGDESIELDEKDLKEFNIQHNNELFDVIEDYVDVEDNSSEISDEMYENAVKKFDSYPFGGGSERMQNGKAYADEKPTNSIIRVDSDVLNKYVNEEDLNSLLYFSQAARDKGIPFPKSKTLSVTYQYILIEALKEVGIEILDIEDIDRDNYKLTIKYNNKIYGVNINNRKFNSAHKVRETLKKKLKIGVVENNDYGELPSPQTTIKSIHNQVNDLDTQIKTKYDVNKFYENKGTYKGIFKIKGEKYYIFQRHDADSSFTEYGEKYYKEKVLPGINEEEYPDPIGKEFKPDTKYPKPKKKHIKKVKIKTTNESIDDEEPVVSSDLDFIEKSNNGMSLEPNGDKVAQFSQDKEETGDMIQGGLADDKLPLEFDPDQILKGMDVEKEHTDNPMIAIEIAMDHLVEDPTYYTTKDTPEASAQAGASKDAKNPENDEEMVDTLLGYEPKNVGDNIDEEYGYEEYQGNIGDRYSDGEGNEFVVRNKVKGGVILKGQGGEREAATGDLTFMKKLNEFGKSKEDNLKQTDPATWHQIQIAKKTIKMPDAMATVMGGMTKDQAREILTKRGIKFTDENYDFAAAEREYATTDALRKYKEYGKKDFNNLTDDEKEEFFDLWNQFRGIEPK